MAQKTGTLSVLVNSVSRIKFIADRKELVDQAIRQLESEGKIVKNIIDGPIQPLGPLGNVFATVDILWEIRDDSENSSVNTASSIRVNEKNLDASLLRASMFLEDEDWNTARAYYNAVLDIDPTCAAAYVGLYLSDKHISSEDEFGSWLSQYKVDNEDKNIKKAIRFGYDKHDLKKYSEDYIAVQAKKAETARKDQILKRAETIIAKPEATIISLKKSLEELKAIPGWKNADGLMYDCRKRIAEIEAFEEAAQIAEAAAQKEKERQAAENRIAAELAKKRLRKTISIVVPIVGVCIIAVVLLITVIIPNRKYNKAIALYNNGQYDEAATLFMSLNGYKDSDDYYSMACKERDYKVATDLFASRDYYHAVVAFSQLKGFKESQIRIDESIRLLLQTCNVGDIVFYGSYEQDNDTVNGKEPIEWIVVAKDGTKVLVISRFGLDCVRYHYSRTEGITWGNSYIRYWLNNNFLNDAFSTGEQKRIIKTTVSADINPESRASQGNDTEDLVYLLSVTEAASIKTDLQCTSTEYAKQRGVRTDLTYGCCWWLRTIGKFSKSSKNAPDAATYYNYDRVNTAGYVFDTDILAVRPVMWVETQ